MQWTYYKVHGINTKTGRKKKLRINALTIDKCEVKAIEAGLSEPFEIEVEPFDEATDKQIEYAKILGIELPQNVNKFNISALIERAVENDRNDPNPQLLEFATDRELEFSEYTGKKALYNTIFWSLKGVDKIAFFIFCVYRWLSEDRDGNLDKHRYKEKFYSFAQELLINKSFVKSLENYSGKQLRFFGNIDGKNGMKYYGGSTQTLAYKLVSDKLKQEFGINTIRKNLPQYEKEPETIQQSNINININTPKKNNVGCLGVMTIGLLVIIILIATIK